MRTRILGIGVVMLAVLGFASCSEPNYATPTTDTLVCVYDGSQKGGEKFKFQVAPGEQSKAVGDEDQVVKIPASVRFWSVTSDRGVADPGTPNWYPGNAAGGTPVTVEGDIAFKFKLDRGCDWFTNYGRRNLNGKDNLGFNVRGDAQQGWFLFLNQYFTGTMQQVVREAMFKYQWQYLHYNYPTNANEAGVLPDGQEPGLPTDQVLGQDLGHRFSEALRAALGDEYFCGIATPTEQDPCPDMTFQVRYAGPNQGGTVSKLVTDRESVENTRNAIESARLVGELQAAQQEQLLAAEKAKAAQKAAEADTALQQARVDTAKCVILAQNGLDCDGHRGTVVINGQSYPG